MKAEIPKCYGALLPDFTRLKFREPLSGHAFTALVLSSGTGRAGRSLTVNSEAWAKCVQCPEYRTCYDLSVLKLLTNQVLMSTMWANPWVGELRRHN